MFSFNVMTFARREWGETKVKNYNAKIATNATQAKENR